MLEDKKQIVRAHLIIKGRVQGVYFRQSMRDVALSLGVVGWVRNLYSGDVEAVVEGPKSAVEEVIEWCKKGPERAYVEDVSIEWETPKSDFDLFFVRR